MKEILLSTVRQLLASKKVLTTLATLITAALVATLLPSLQHAGLPVNESMISIFVYSILGLGGITVAGQGLQDHGKEAARIDAIADNPELAQNSMFSLGGLFSTDTLITLGVNALLSAIKGPNKLGTIRGIAFKVYQQILIAYPDFAKASTTSLVPPPLV